MRGIETLWRFGREGLVALRTLASRYLGRSRAIDLSIPGWMSAGDLRVIAAAAARVPSGGTIVEIGPFLGRSSYAISTAAKPGVVVYVVDSWNWLPNDYGPEMPGGPIDPRADAEALFVEYTAGCRNIVRIKGLSPEAHPPPPERGFDFVFIDGDHLSPGFDRDVEFYFSNLAADGILMGDDYDPVNWPDIVRFLGMFSERTRCTVERRGDKLWKILRSPSPLPDGMLRKTRGPI
jgi:hypothetical protein